MAEHTSLKRNLSYPLLTLYGLGTILGAGIYVLVGKVAATSGLYAPVAFLLAAVLAGFSAYSYAGLSSRYPAAAGEAVYIQAAFGSRFCSSLIGWMVVITGLVSAATIANGFVGYLQVFISVSEFWAISCLIIILAFIACWGVLESVAIAVFVTLLELAGLLLVVVFAGGAISNVADELPRLMPSLNDGAIWYSIILGAFLAFYAFIGFEDMVNMAEEVKQPEKTLPKAIMTALIVSSVLYVLIAVIAVLTLPIDVLANSTAPMKDLLAIHNQKAGVIISLISLVAVVNGALVQIIMGARVLYGMAKQGLAPPFLGAVHKVRQTPVLATVLISIVVWFLAVALPLVSLAKITSFIIILVFFGVNCSLIMLKLKEKDAPPLAMKVSLWVPIVAALMCVLFLFIQVIQLMNGLVI